MPDVLRPVLRRPMRPVLGRPITPIKGGASLQRMLFGNGENGFLFYPPSDLTRMFTVWTGPPNVAANDDPVGLWLDNHSWAGASYATIVAGQTDLATNGGFDSDTVWSKGANWSISGGKATHATGASDAIAETASLSASTLYCIQGTISGRTAGSLTPRFTGGTTVNANAISANGAFVCYILAVTGNSAVSFVASSTFDGSLDDVSIKAIPGNHALNATSTQRPLYKTNSGKPYLNFDGTDDRLLSAFVPTNALTMIVAGRSTAATVNFMGASGAGATRARIILDASGKAGAAWGAQTGLTAGSDIRNQDHVLILTGTGASYTLYLDGAVHVSETTTGSPVGTYPLAVGASNNSGTAGAFLAGRIHAAAAVNREVTPAEIARITSDFTRLF